MVSSATPPAGRLRVWHESLLPPAREDDATALSTSGVAVLTLRPLPVGTPVFLELPSMDGGPPTALDGQVSQSGLGRMQVRFSSVDEVTRARIEAAMAAWPTPKAETLPPLPEMIHEEPAAAPPVPWLAVVPLTPPPLTPSPLTPSPLTPCPGHPGPGLLSLRPGHGAHGGRHGGRPV